MTETRGPRARLRHSAFISAWILTLPASSAIGGDEESKARAGALVDLGNEQLARGDADGAVRSYTEAYQTYPSPKILYNLAEAHKSARDEPGAVDAFERFLLAGGAEPGSELEATVRAELERLSRNCGWIALDAPRKGATLLVDEVVVDQHRPRCVRPGEHRVESREDGRTRAMSVVVNLGEHVRVDLETPADRGTVRDEDADTQSLPWWVWVGLGVAVVGAGIGIGFAASGSDPLEGELGSTNTSAWSRF